MSKPSGIDNWSSLPWKDIIPRLLYFSRHLMRRVPQHSRAPGEEAEDFVWTAIEKTMSGTRQWDPLTTSILQHLMGVISSDFYNAVRKQIRSRTIDFDEAVYDALKSDAPSPEDVALSNDEWLSLMKYLERKDRRLAELLSRTILLGAEPLELSEMMKLPLAEIYKLKRKMREEAAAFLGRSNSSSAKVKEKV